MLDIGHLSLHIFVAGGSDTTNHAVTMTPGRTF
jgi:hypothetical protein